MPTTIEPHFYNLAKQHLLSIANIYAPTGREQSAFVSFINETELGMYQAEGPTKTLSILLGALKDGIDHGNWPIRQ